jgi:hypothetical protein
VDSETPLPEIWPPFDLGALPRYVADLLLDIPLGLAALEGVWQAAVEGAEQLLEPFEDAPWSFWLALLTLTAVAYEITRRDMTRTPTESPGSLDPSDPTAI